MILYPAIDLQGGRCVRLRQGEASESTDYGDPLEAARTWKAQGTAWLHVVDLDGAFSGNAQNLSVIAEVVKATGLSVQLGGGIRTMEDIAHRLDNLGIARVVLGTVALDNPALVREACGRYPGRIACGIDAREGKVAVRGWTRQSDRSALDLALEMRDAGVETLIYTDIARDGMLNGPNISATAGLVEQTGMQVIGSGGVGSLSDIVALREAGCAGAIVGKALYSGQFTLEEAMEVAE